MDSIALSVVAPAHNEAENVRDLVEQVGAAGEKAGEILGGGFEFVLVDDGSTDETQKIAREMAAERPWLRIIAMRETPPGKGNGQSAAFHAGFRAARGVFIGSLDADLQNDPADYVGMAQLIVSEGADMVQGDRSRNRRDTAVRRWGSIVGRTFRGWILGDKIRDTGCSLRIMRTEIALRLPLEFKGVHRFIPALANQMGYKVVEMGVTHRPRVAGETKYGMGITQRAIPGLIDCFAIRWMGKRRRTVLNEEVGAAARADEGAREGAA